MIHMPVPSIMLVHLSDLTKNIKWGILNTQEMGVTVNAHMKVSEQCGITVSKGNQLLRLIRRNITLYIDGFLHCTWSRECLILWFCCATELGFSEDIGAKEVIFLLLLLYKDK